LAAGNPLLEQHPAQQVVCAGLLVEAEFFTQRLGYKLALLEAHRRKFRCKSDLPPPPTLLQKASQPCRIRDRVRRPQRDATLRQDAVFRRTELRLNLEGSSRVKMLL
jgi:hypothetical protein